MLRFECKWKGEGICRLKYWSKRKVTLTTCDEATPLDFIFCLFVWFVLSDWLLSCRSGWPTHYVFQVSFEPKAICLPQPSEHRGSSTHVQLSYLILYSILRLTFFLWKFLKSKIFCMKVLLDKGKVVSF